MKKILCFLLLASCGSKSNQKPVNLSQLEQEISQRKHSFPLCNEYPSKVNCSNGDMVLFNGLLCLSGESVACEYVRNSQDTKGRFWRAPERIEIDQKDSFSRDMAIGVLAYVTKTKDFQALQKWENYRNSIDGKLCPDATDGRCNFTANIKNLENAVNGTLTKLELTQYLATLTAQAEFVPAGFESHLVAAQYYVLSKAITLATKTPVNILYKKQPSNPFFAALAGAKQQSADIAVRQIQETNGTQFQWSIERDTLESAWKDSMGWEFVFLLNILR